MSTPGSPEVDPGFSTYRTPSTAHSEHLPGTKEGGVCGVAGGYTGPDHTHSYVQTCSQFLTLLRAGALCNDITAPVKR